MILQNIAKASNRAGAARDACDPAGSACLFGFLTAELLPESPGAAGLANQ